MKIPHFPVSDSDPCHACNYPPISVIRRGWQAGGRRKGGTPMAWILAAAGSAFFARLVFGARLSRKGAVGLAMLVAGTAVMTAFC